MMSLTVRQGMVDSMLVVVDGLNIALVIVAVVKAAMSWVIGRVVAVMMAVAMIPNIVVTITMIALVIRLAVVRQSVVHGMLMIVHRLNISLIIVSVVKAAVRRMICRVVAVMMGISVLAAFTVVAVALVTNTTVGR